MGKKIKKPESSTQKVHQEQAEAQLDKKTLLTMGSQQQLALLKELFQQITSQPETHFKQVDSIFILTKSANVQVSTTALRVLGQIFVDVAPLEPVDLKEIEQRKKVKITKQQYKVIKFEELLVGQYERYLKMIKEINTKLTVTDLQGDQELYREFKKCLLQSLIKCLGTLWNFNHFKLLSELLTKFVKHQQARAALSNFLMDKNVSTFRAKARVISDIANLIKHRPESALPDELIKIVNSTFVDFRYLQKEVESLKFQKKKLTKKLYRQKAKQKKKEGENKEAERGSLEMKAKIKKEKAKQKMRVKEEVEKEFAEGQATLKKKELVKANSEVLHQIYYIYFKILVERPHSKFLADILEGILTFAHLINIDLTSTLITHLDSALQHQRQLWLQSRNQHALESRIRLAFTAQSLLNGPLAVYNMDDLKATTALYTILKDVNDNGVHINREHFRMVCISLEEALLKRRQLSQEVVASLLREMVRLVTKKETPKLYILELIRQIASKYSKVGRMFEADNQGYGLYGFNPHAFDPQATNAINTELVTSLQPLTHPKKAKSEYSQHVVELTQRLLRQTFMKMEGVPGLEDLLQQDLNQF